MNARDARRSRDQSAISNSKFPLDVVCEVWTPQDGDRDAFFMRRAVDEAIMAAEEGEIPIGAALVFQNRILARNHNRREQLCDPTAHAETLVLRDASVFYPSWRIEDAELFVTLEPCLMCAGAALQARIERVVVGARDPKGGAVFSLYQTLDDERLNWRAKVDEGVLREECAKILVDFFRARRERKTKTPRTNL